jgi:acetylornithine deacetylase/succinyl-diaminopimelate desuccinylase-like protein
LDWPLGDIFETVDDSSEELVGDLRRVLRQPSVTDNEADCKACAELVAGLIRDSGFEAELLPSWHNPLVFGRTEQREGRPTLLVTGHYDVVPTGPEADWRYPPFSAELDDRGTIFARGACDPKGNIVASIEAARVLQRTFGDTAVNLKFLFEGDDEGPGEHLTKMTSFAEAHRDLLCADAVLLVDSGFSRSGHSAIHLGTAGSLALELKVRTGSKPPAYIHTQLVPDAAFRLVWAMASLKSPDERVTVEGFYDDVRAPSPSADAWLAEVPWNDEAERAFWGVSELLTGVSGLDAVRRMVYAPTCSIHGIEPGLERANSDSMVPNEARAWINFHLVADQNPDDIYRKVRRHLDLHGFEDVEIETVRSFAPLGGASPDAPIGQAALKASSQAGVGAYLLPDSYEIGDKWCCLADRLGIDGALFGIGDPDRAAHMPNEHISVDYFLQGIKWIAATYCEFATAAHPLQPAQIGA